MDKENRINLAQIVKAELEIIAKTNSELQDTLAERYLLSLVDDSLKGISKEDLNTNIRIVMWHYVISDNIKSFLESIRLESIKIEGEKTLDSYLRRAMHPRISEDSISNIQAYNLNYIPELKYAKELSKELGITLDPAVENKAIQNLKEYKKQLLGIKISEYTGYVESTKRKLREIEKEKIKYEKEYAPFLKVYNSVSKINNSEKNQETKSKNVSNNCLINIFLKYFKK